MGAAIGGFIWFLLAKFDVQGIGDWTPEDLAYAGGTTAVILTFVFAYLTPNGNSEEPPS